MIKIDTIGNHPVNVRAERSLDDKGWTVYRGAKGERVVDYFDDNGGQWRLNSDGTLGRQLAGTGQVQAPRSPAAFEPWLRQRIGHHLDVYALDY